MLYLNLLGKLCKTRKAVELETPIPLLIVALKLHLGLLRDLRVAVGYVLYSKLNLLLLMSLMFFWVCFIKILATAFSQLLFL